MDFEEVKRGNDTRTDAARNRLGRDAARDRTERARPILPYCFEVGCPFKMKTNVWCQGYCKKHARANGFVPPGEDQVKLGKEEKNQEGAENKKSQKNVEDETKPAKCDDFNTTVTSDVGPERKKPLVSMSTLLRLASKKNKLPQTQFEAKKQEKKGFQEWDPEDMSKEEYQRLWLQKMGGTKNKKRFMNAEGNEESHFFDEFTEMQERTEPPFLPWNQHESYESLWYNAIVEVEAEARGVAREKQGRKFK